MTFLKYFDKHVIHIKLVDKDDSWFMKLISFFLAIGNFLHITNIQNFMGGYGTTIGHTLYDNPGWDWDAEPDTHKCHELCHAVQASIKMSLRYLFRPEWRMFYESECAQCEILCFPDLVRGDIWFERRVRQFVAYGIKEKIVRRELTKRLDEIERGEPRSSAARVAHCLIAWRSEHGA